VSIERPQCIAILDHKKRAKPHGSLKSTERNHVMAEAKTLPLAVACTMHSKAMEEAMAWACKDPGNGANTLHVKTYMAGFDIGFTQCLRVLDEAGYIVRGGSQPANPDKAKSQAERYSDKVERRGRAQLERLLKNVERQCENL
jgi:hypothetical protein